MIINSFDNQSMPIMSLKDFYGYELYAFVQPGDVLIEDNYDVTGLCNDNHGMTKLLIALEILKRL